VNSRECGRIDQARRALLRAKRRKERARNRRDAEPVRAAEPSNPKTQAICPLSCVSSARARMASQPSRRPIQPCHSLEIRTALRQVHRRPTVGPRSWPSGGQNKGRGRWPGPSSITIRQRGEGKAAAGGVPHHRPYPGDEIGRRMGDDIRRGFAKLHHLPPSSITGTRSPRYEMAFLHNQNGSRRTDVDPSRFALDAAQSSCALGADDRVNAPKGSSIRIRSAAEARACDPTRCLLPPDSF